MREQDIAIVKSLVSVAWADGEYTEAEHEMVESLINAYQPTDEEVRELLDYAAEKKTLDDIPMTELSPDDSRALLHQAVLLTFVDGEPAESEKSFVDKLAVKLRLPADESKALIESAEQHARQFMQLL